ncbi:NAD(P)-dependent oxidoreductase [Sphingomonas morindae]|uniref:NAD(P)-dependent oxidoreductase n=1 Tax=Sphingomonas morindae TaxID=1541170 RepID=A0ABY4XAY3_9SPHN|nr:NAD(P)-dependent oxidoreductase [Sphingomonas morindae]USI73841.1 NAD(P)-dependent oxidoreductase [Sphingomonas morindae]
MHIGFIGLGGMGAAMASNLVRAGHDLTVFNRSRDKAAPLAEMGARVAEDIAGACTGECVVTMLADDAAVRAVALGPDGIVAHLAPGAIHISSSTIGLDCSKALAEAHAAAGQRFVAAPVFGRPDAAEAARLFVVAAGAPEALAACEPVFDAIGQRSFLLGDEPSAATIAKIGGNFLIASTIEALGEALALGARGGIDPHAYLDLLTNTLFGAPVHKTYGALIADGAFTPARFAAPLGAKDVGLALEAARALKVPLPLAGLIHDRFVRLINTGGAERDWAALGGLAFEDAGLPPQSPAAASDAESR